MCQSAPCIHFTPGVAVEYITNAAFSSHLQSSPCVKVGSPWNGTARLCVILCLDAPLQNSLDSLDCKYNLSVLFKSVSLIGR